MTFKRLAGYFSKLEETSSRLKMTEILSELFREAGETEVGQICFLLQGRIAPQFIPLEFGMADKMMVKAVVKGLGITEELVTREFKKTGDLGVVISNLKASIVPNQDSRDLEIGKVYEVLFNTAAASGEGSQEEKINLLGNLIKEIDVDSARFIVRIPLGKLRLGFSDMTILDSLSWMIDDSKTHREEIERAYNVRPDLSFISTTLKKKGLNGLKSTQPTVGTPILMARAERMSTGAEIIEKIGRCAVEPKYDGFRLQVHFQKFKVQSSKFKTKTENLKLLDDEPKEFVRLYSRNLEDVTHMYPDVVNGIIKQINADDAILEGEAIAFNPSTGEYLPFQETVQRKRKYDITQKAKEIPLKLVAFDLLYLNGENLMGKSYQKRREKLEKILN